MLDKDHSGNCHQGCFCHTSHDRNYADIDLFTPLKIRGLELKNRIVVSPMCQYSAKDGLANDWHLVHLGSRAVGGASVVFVEATAVLPEGRISPFDLGLWHDEQISPLNRIANFIASRESYPAIQLAHAGRKASSDAPWMGGGALQPSKGGWEVSGPSSIAFDKLIPKALSKEEILKIIQAFKASALRAVNAGFKIIEIHAAHGYLLHEFLSPLSNQRQDEYGGSFENRIRLLCEIARELRNTIPSNLGLFVRISATDWIEEGWSLEDSVELAIALKKLEVDLVDVSSGGMVKQVKIPIEKNYQVGFAETIKNEADIKTGAVGLITEFNQANEIVTSGKADLVFIGREFLRDPYWALKAQQALGYDPQWPIPYGYAVKKRV